MEDSSKTLWLLWSSKKHCVYYNKFSKNSSKHCQKQNKTHTQAQIWCSLKTRQNTRAQISGVLCRLLAATLTAIFRAPYAAATTGRAITPASVRWIALWADSKKETIIGSFSRYFGQQIHSADSRVLALWVTKHTVHMPS